MLSMSFTMCSRCSFLFSTTSNSLDVQVFIFTFSIKPFFLFHDCLILFEQKNIQEKLHGTSELSLTIANNLSKDN